jgi:hypothetical protein
MSLTTDGTVIAFATLLGPVAAVQAQKWVERARDHANQRMFIFTTLMTTRTTRLVPEHARALNMIDFAFYGPRLFGFAFRGKSNQAVLDAWNEYRAHLNPDPPIPLDDQERGKPWLSRGDELFLNLLYAISTRVGYKFDRQELRAGSYYPMMAAIIDEEASRLRKLLIGALDGSGRSALTVVAGPAMPAPQINPPGPTTR